MLVTDSFRLQAAPEEMVRIDFLPLSNLVDQSEHLTGIDSDERNGVVLGEFFKGFEN